LRLKAGRRWNLADEANELFDGEHLAVIERGLNNPTAYAVLLDSLGRLEQIVLEAKRRGLLGFRCHMGRLPEFSLEMCFGDYNGNRYKASMSFRKAYEKNRLIFDMEIASSLKNAVESLVLSVEGIGALRRI
jgi:hypothetical protein